MWQGCDVPFSQNAQISGGVHCRGCLWNGPISVGREPYGQQPVGGTNSWCRVLWQRGWLEPSDGEVAKVKDLSTVDHFRKRPYQCWSNVLAPLRFPNYKTHCTTLQTNMFIHFPWEHHWTPGSVDERNFLPPVLGLKGTPVALSLAHRPRFGWNHATVNSQV